MAGSAVRVKGYRECARAARRAGNATNKEVRAAFKQVGEPVRADATSKFALIDMRSASGFVVRVRQKGIAVEQRLKKTTGKRGDYGSLQMRRALIPALHENEDEIEKAMDNAIDKVADIFDRGA
jgi:hypothetical protein